ncbi:hypothetical protein MMC08_003429 [Hypocenomyce scalaris]|nr:hypothetical protein [Hypocenomyce scalaris]
MVVWNRLIRFETNDGHIYFGEPIVKDDEDIASLAESGQLKAAVLTGDDVFDSSAKVTSNVQKVKRLLGPLTASQVPIIRCVGLNYMKHIKEGGRSPPPYPSMFFKPAECVADHGSVVHVPKLAQDQCDYEGELTIVIGKDGRDISEEDALDYVAGYVAGDDVSARKWQRDPAYAGGVPQWCFSKGFDAFAPLGPCIVSTSLLGDASNQTLRTLVNGEVRQDSNTSDLLFGVKKVVSFLSQGTTLRKGSLIMTGTPSGVAMGMKNPLWLKDGDVIEVYIEGIGTLKHKIAFS